jgi:hypothetical protein
MTPQDIYLGLVHIMTSGVQSRFESLTEGAKYSRPFVTVTWPSSIMSKEEVLHATRYKNRTECNQRSKDGRHKKKVSAVFISLAVTNPAENTFLNSVSGPLHFPLFFLLIMSSCDNNAASRRNNNPWHENNNVGVHYLNHGDYAQAFQCFRSALANCNGEAEPSAGITYSCNAHQIAPSKVKHHWSNACLLRDAATTTAIRSSPQSHSDFNTHSTMIYTHGIPIFFSNHLKEEMKLAIIVFNLGLVFHLQALQDEEAGSSSSSSSSHDHLSTAWTLYQQASRLLSRTLQVGTTATSNPLPDLLMLALMNNKANLGLLLFRDQPNVMFQEELSLGQLIQYAWSVRESDTLYDSDDDDDDYSQWVLFMMKEQAKLFLFHAALSQILPNLVTTAAAA